MRSPNESAIWRGYGDMKSSEVDFNVVTDRAMASGVNRTSASTETRNSSFDWSNSCWSAHVLPIHP